MLYFRQLVKSSEANNDDPFIFLTNLRRQLIKQERKAKKAADEEYKQKLLKMKAGAYSARSERVKSPRTEG